MIRSDVFMVRITPEERQMIDRLAEHEERTASDAVRRLIHRAVKQLEQNDDRAPRRQTESAIVCATDPS